jgi:hypothetical protein
VGGHLKDSAGTVREPADHGRYQPLGRGGVGGFGHAPYVVRDRFGTWQQELADEIMPAHRAEYGPQQDLALVEAESLADPRPRIVADAGQRRGDDVAHFPQVITAVEADDHPSARPGDAAKLRYRSAGLRDVVQHVHREGQVRGAVTKRQGGRVGREQRQARPPGVGCALPGRAQHAG